MKKIIYLTHRIPFPPNKGDKIRSYHILKFLKNNYDIYLGTFVDDPADEKYIFNLNQSCKDIYMVKTNKYIAYVKACVRSFFKKQSISEAMYYSVALERWIDNLVETQCIDAIFCFSSAMGQYCLKYKDKIKIHIIDYVDVDSEKWREYSLRRPFPLNFIYQREAKKLLAMEIKLATTVHASLFVTEEERHLFDMVSNVKIKTHAIQNGVDIEYFDPDLNCINPYANMHYNIVFTGRMDYWPNVDAVKWFCENIFEKIQDRLPQVKLYIVGAKPTNAVLNLAKKQSVIVTGQVDDIRPYLKYAAIAIAPLRIGRGIQNKVLEAMAMNIPLVVSQEALTGINLKYNLPIVIAKTNEEWISAVTKFLLKQPDHQEIKNLRRNIIECYSWDNTLKPLNDLLVQYA